MSTFFWGVLGSGAVELVALYGTYLSGENLPPHYRCVGFWAVRVALAFVAGGLVLGYGVKTPLLAIHLGAATPLVIQSLASNAKKFLPPE